MMGENSRQIQRLVVLPEFCLLATRHWPAPTKLPQRLAREILPRDCDQFEKMTYANCRTPLHAAFRWLLDQSSQGLNVVIAKFFSDRSAGDFSGMDIQPISEMRVVRDCLLPTEFCNLLDVRQRGIVQCVR